MGWDRSGGGENPAALAAPGWTASVAGYAPFGLEGLRVTEAVAAWDHARWGLSGSYRGAFTEVGSGGPSAMAVGLQSAVNLKQVVTTGISGYYRAEPGSAAVTGTWGILWRPKPWGSLGGFWAAEETPWGGATRAGLGVEGGSRFRGIGWRLCVESVYARERWETRFGTGLQLHALLSLYAGWDRSRETAALGVRFGIGDWEAFSAMRRHAALGGTSVQGIRWRSPPRQATP